LVGEPQQRMDQAEQQRLTRSIGRALLKVAPPDWTEIRAEYRSAGRHIEVDVFVAGPDRLAHPVRPPMEVVDGLGRLRHGMYQPGRGTWLSALYLLEPPSSFSAEFDLDLEPRWRRPPPPIGFQDELRFFPRTPDHIPPWLRARAGLPPLDQPVQPLTGTPNPPAGQPPIGAPNPPAGQPSPTPPVGFTPPPHPAGPAPANASHATAGSPSRPPGQPPTTAPHAHTGPPPPQPSPTPPAGFAPSPHPGTRPTAGPLVPHGHPQHPPATPWRSQQPATPPAGVRQPPATPPASFGQPPATPPAAFGQAPATPPATVGRPPITPPAGHPTQGDPAQPATAPWPTQPPPPAHRPADSARTPPPPQPST
jgi:hypothetical protein